MGHTPIGPFQPSHKFGRYQHETLEQHEQAIDTDEKLDTNNEVRFQVTGPMPRHVLVLNIY